MRKSSNSRKRASRSRTDEEQEAPVAGFAPDTAQPDLPAAEPVLALPLPPAEARSAAPAESGKPPQAQLESAPEEQQHPTDPARVAAEARHIDHALGKALWIMEYAPANPNATTDERQQSWKTERQRYLRRSRHLQTVLQRFGCVLQVTPDGMAKMAQGPDTETAERKAP